MVVWLCPVCNKPLEEVEYGKIVMLKCEKCNMDFAYRMVE